MKLRGILYLFILLLLYNCKNNSLDKKDALASKKSSEKKDSIFLNKVVITGSTDDITAFKYINIMNETYLFGRSHLDVTKEIFSDSLHMVLNSIDKPLYSEVATGGDSAFYRGYIFLIPGDTISIKIKNGEMKFFGKNAIHNNFYSEMSKQTPNYLKNPYEGNLNLYKKNIKSIYDKKIAFLNQYIKNNNIQSKLFINTTKSHLRHRYLFCLINPINVKPRIEGIYLNSIDELLSIIQKETSRNSEGIIDVSNYFEKITIDEFKDVNALNNIPFFKNNINAYIRYYFLDSEFLAYSKEKFLAEKEFIENNFEGETKVYAIARMLRDYHKKGFGKGLNAIGLMKNTIDEYEGEFTKPSYIEGMNEIKQDLESYGFELSESALNTKFINTIGDTLTLKKIFARSNKRIRIIDFWATWCLPCIRQIKEGKSFKDRLHVENNVEWIYISPENNYQQWLKKNKEFKNVLNFTNSFFLLNGRKSSLTSSLKVKEFPRYVILNKENMIVLNNAPSPSDEEFFEQIIDNVYNKN